MPVNGLVWKVYENTVSMQRPHVTLRVVVFVPRFYYGCPKKHRMRHAEAHKQTLVRIQLHKQRAKQVHRHKHQTRFQYTDGAMHTTLTALIKHHTTATHTCRRSDPEKSHNFEWASPAMIYRPPAGTLPPCCCHVLHLDKGQPSGTAGKPRPCDLLG